MTTRPTSKPKLDSVTGLLLLDKPAGVTSNSALQHAKKLLQAKKAGHTGSLDPIATGLLPLCFGEATKVSSFFLEADKRYRTRIKLGEATDTGDAEGKVIESADCRVTAEDIENSLGAFRGRIDQIPPMYSALKRDGQPLYKLARQGIEVEREPRQVHVYELTMQGFEPPYLDIEVHCSSGFYVRVLAEEIGAALGCGGHVTALRRLSVGSLDVTAAITLDELEALPDAETRRKRLITADQGLGHIPQASLSMDAAFYICRGQPVKAAQLPDSGWVRLYAEGAGFLGVGAVQDDGRVAPKRLFHRI